MVHAVVVLLALAILGTIALAVRPSWRLRYGWLVVGVAAVATALMPVATSSGEALEERVAREPEAHAELGETLIWFGILLLVFLVAMVWLAHRQAEEEDDAREVRPALLRTVTVLAVVAALAAGVQLYRVGDSGAKATWEDVAAAPVATGGNG